MFLGVDVGLHSLFACLFDPRRRRLLYPSESLRPGALIPWVQPHRVLNACLDAPPQPNQGLLAQLLPAVAKGGRNRRITEYGFGIGGCYGTPSTPPLKTAHNGWMAAGMELYERLANHFGWTVDLGGGRGELIEGHPTYDFRALLGVESYDQYGISRFRLDPRRQLRPKKTKAGFEQRIKLLEQLCDQLRVPVTDEIRAKWRSRIDWVDATICSLVCYLKSSGAPGVIPAGHPKEGSIYLYIPRKPLLL